MPDNTFFNESNLFFKQSDPWDGEELAVPITEESFNALEKNSLVKAFFSRSDLEKILGGEESRCVGIRFYPAMDTQGNHTAFAIGVNTSRREIISLTEKPYLLSEGVDTGTWCTYSDFIDRNRLMIQKIGKEGSREIDEAKQEAERLERKKAVTAAIAAELTAEETAIQASFAAAAVAKEKSAAAAELAEKATTAAELAAATAAEADATVAAAVAETAATAAAAATAERATAEAAATAAINAAEITEEIDNSPYKQETYVDDSFIFTAFFSRKELTEKLLKGDSIGIWLFHDHLEINSKDGKFVDTYTAAGMHSVDVPDYLRSPAPCPPDCGGQDVYGSGHNR